jgi:hypothetical protein
VIQVKFQVVLNTITANGYYDAFKKWHKYWEQCTHAGGDYFEGDGG